MARQRFVHPSMWTDGNFGRLKLEERILFIAIFSNADDDGRLVADPGVLRGLAFAFDDLTLRKVRAIRDQLSSKMPSVCLYTRDGTEYIALLKWDEYQKPQYRKPSKLPAPLPSDSVNVHGSFMEASVKPDGSFDEASHRGLGLDREGKGRAVDTEGSEDQGRPSGEQPSSESLNGEHHDPVETLAAQFGTMP